MGDPAFRLAVAGRVLEIVKGDITRETTEAIANAANSTLAGGGGVDGAIHKAAGPTVMAELRERYPGCPTGSAVITAGGNLPAKWILHAVGPVYAGTPDDAELLESAYRTCLILCEQHHIASVAFPSISTGVYGYPVDEAAPVAVRTVIRQLQEREWPSLARFVLFDDRTLAAYVEASRASSADLTAGHSGERMEK